MGYTHYFAYDSNARPFISAWPEMVRDAKLIAWCAQRVLGVRLAGGRREGRPVFNCQRICLNGPAADLLANEAFLIDPMPLRAWDGRPGPGNDGRSQQARQLDTRGFTTSFCKTGRKPHDIAVTSVLLRCHHLAPEAFVIASDGDWERDWCHGACGSKRAPVSVVELLFAQVETIDNSRLVPNVYDGPSSADVKGPCPGPAAAPSLTTDDGHES
jgi:hypothetical protein